MAGIGFDSKHDFAILPSAGASPLPLDVGYLFLVRSNILLSMTVQQRIVILEFPQEKMNAHPSTPSPFM